jgi:hypothetical protein
MMPQKCWKHLELKNVKTDNECYPGMAIHEINPEWVMILKIL